MLFGSWTEDNVDDDDFDGRREADKEDGSDEATCGLFLFPESRVDLLAFGLSSSFLLLPLNDEFFELDDELGGLAVIDDNCRNDDR